MLRFFAYILRFFFFSFSRSLICMYSVFFLSFWNVVYVQQTQHQHSNIIARKRMKHISRYYEKHLPSIRLFVLHSHTHTQTIRTQILMIELFEWLSFYQHTNTCKLKYLKHFSMWKVHRGKIYRSITIVFLFVFVASKWSAYFLHGTLALNQRLTNDFTKRAPHPNSTLEWLSRHRSNALWPNHVMCVCAILVHA